MSTGKQTLMFEETLRHYHDLMVAKLPKSDLITPADIASCVNCPNDRIIELWECGELVGINTSSQRRDLKIFRDSAVHWFARRLGLEE